ncbi:2OG-Fe(II) oxygenase superfamily domain-containing protein [Hirsutella rhossiliensis]|uniref:2OG-Fe(II) oxygenase superfamily domain-containing protein n=1 Tax=Hirsutella rhossiliensis TaxID=111463 RepID=A0A9P8SE95_9HYPO|nr:2OG-Fe(II) oxygenase superfamily domain-containing protein [Hirsutella rhossiliensis]KAH0958160.1 2OG-Fe(II) oxygenase superfamily domain-containing protein [Hirsutella rhossiliensis]
MAMDPDGTTSPSSNTMELRLASGNGPVTRTVLRSPVRDAEPSEIPVIDLSRLFSDTLADREAVASQIHDAASNMGFFYVKNHGIPLQEIRGAYEAALDFFRQGPAEKIKADATEGPYDSGWRGPRTQRVNPDEGVDVRETIPHEAAQYIGQGKPAFEGTEQVPQLKESLERYYKSCLALARALTRAFALSLGLYEDAFDTKVQYPDASLEVNFYPPLAQGSDSSSSNSARREPKDADSRISIGSHTDFLFFTMLWQDDVGGLQVLNHEGQWIAAKPIEGTLVVNIGDYMQRITNDRYVSTVHRAKNWSGRERATTSVKVATSVGMTLTALFGRDSAPPLDITGLYVTFYNQGRISTMIKLEALASVRYAKKKAIATIPFPGAAFNVTGIATIGPAFRLDDKIDVGMTVSAEFETNIDIASWQIRQTIPAEDGAHEPKPLDQPDYDKPGG